MVTSAIMAQPELDNLVRIGRLKAEPGTQPEIGPIAGGSA